MKQLLTIFIFIITIITLQNSHAQNIEFEKVINKENVNYAIYYKVLKNHTLRFSNTFQLFDVDLKKVWEITLADFFDDIEHMVFYGDINIVSDNNDIYFSQLIFNPTVNSKMVTAVWKIDALGNIKRINLNENLGLTHISQFEIINNKIVLSELTKTPILSKEEEFHTKVSIINKDLNTIEDTILLPLHIKNTDINLDWFYSKTLDDKIIYTAYYYESVGYEIKSSYKYKHSLIQRNIELSTNLEILSDTIIDLGNEQKLNRADFYTWPLKYDDTKFNVLLNDEVLTRIRKTPRNTYYSSIEINKKDIFPGLFKVANLKPFGLDKSLMLVEIFEDPINESVNLIFSDLTLTSFTIITLDKYFTPSKLVQVKTSYSGTIGSHINNLSFSLEKLKRVKGSFPEDYKLNALDYALTLSPNQYVTIVNHSDYQLLFTDNIELGETKVYKVTR